MSHRAGNRYDSLYLSYDESDDGIEYITEEEYQRRLAEEMALKERRRREEEIWYETEERKEKKSRGGKSSGEKVMEHDRLLKEETGKIKEKKYKKVKKNPEMEKETGKKSGAEVKERDKVEKKKEQEGEEVDSSENQEAKKRKTTEKGKSKKEEVKETDNESFGDLVMKVMKETNTILEVINRGQGKETWMGLEEQSRVKDAVANILMRVLSITVKQNELQAKMMEEREIRRFAEKREDERKGERESEWMKPKELEAREKKGFGWDETRTRRQNRTYAEVSRNNGVNGSRVNGERIEGRVVVSGKDGWKMPNVKARGEKPLVIVSREGESARKVMEKVVSGIPSRDIGGVPPVARETRDGRVIIVPKDKSQKEKIKKEIRKMKDIEVREAKKVEPLLIVSGVERGMTEEELTEKLKKGLELSENEGVKEVKVVKRIACRNMWRENVIVRTGLKEFKAAVMKGKVELGSERYYVEEYLDLAMCFNCCRFGHVAKYCRDRKACYRCGEEHDGRGCEEEEGRCVNCYRNGWSAYDHGARDKGCPVLREMLVRLRKTIAYE